MKIAIDLRSLSSGGISGVENYTINIVENLLQLDRKNQFRLFYNSFGGSLPTDYHYVNSQLAASKIPNKILNLGFKFGLSKVEKFTGEVDWFFMPNLNQFNISPKTKLAVTVHDLSPVVAPEFYNIKRRAWHWFLNYRRAFERADLIFTVSEYTKRDLSRLFMLPESKIKVIYPGVDADFLRSQAGAENVRELRNIKSIPGEYILFLNTIEPRKNLENLIKAYEALNTTAYLLIAGKSGWKNSKIFTQIAKSKKRNKIIYIGYVAEAEKPPLIKAASILVYPSLYEGFGFQPLEAMALGVPVIASQVTAIPEVAGDAALLINPYNVKDLTSAMEILLKNENLRQSFVKKGYERVKNFNWQVSARQILLNFENFDQTKKV